MIPKTSTTLLRNLQSDVKCSRWAEFVARYEPMLRAYLQLHYPRVEADDVLQESFLALMQALPSFRYDPKERGLFRNYLTGIVRNRALQACREQDRRQAFMAVYDSAPAAAQEGTELAEELLEIALQELLADPTISAQSKQIFTRVTIDGEAPHMVAEQFGVTRNNVDQIKNRLTKRLQTQVAALEKLL